VRTHEELEALAVEAYGPYAAVSVPEVVALAREIRAMRRGIATLAARSACGRTVRYAQRVLARDALGVDGGTGRDALGQPLRPLPWIEHALRGAGGERAAVTPAELRALVAECRRLGRAIDEISARSRCARSRDFAQRVLASAGTAGTGQARPLSCSRKVGTSTLRAVVGE